MANTSRRPRLERRKSSRQRHPSSARGPRHLFLRQLATADRGALVVLSAIVLVTVAHYLSRHPAVLATLLVLLGLAATASGCLWGHSQYRRWRRAGHGAPPTRLKEWRRLSPGGLERAVAGLCRRDGCTRVRVLSGVGGRAGAVRARTPDGRQLLVHCEPLGPDEKAGADVLYEVNAARHDTGCHLAVVVTTNTFTPDAVDWNGELPAPVALFGSRQLLRWAYREGPPPWQQPSVEEESAAR
ncbi:restriction endonuclease [Streptomyces sp. NPDC012765]|uniref:restriction endonuclease n=1 Tax=Streptomyces sp. NPDC012765 TaxID=3155249 RepID=UPI0033DF6436